MQHPETATGLAEPESRQRDAARLELTTELNQLLRRLRSYRDEAEWVAAVSEGASRFSGASALFAVQDNAVRLLAQNNLSLAQDFSMPLTAGAAFSTAVSTKDPVVALCTPPEVGPALGSADRSRRAHIFPILNGARPAAILFATGRERIDINGLELLAGIASLALQRPQNAALHTQIASAPVRGDGNETREPKKTPAPGNHRAMPAWTRLSAEERAIHIRAQRFARVKVAEMEIAKPEACRAGREEGNFYLFLKREIDAARDSYRKQFMTAPHVVDYLHLELVRTAVDGDEQKLGADYPGQLS